MPAAVRFWFDFASTYSYLAAERLGLFGAPSFTVGGELSFGQDRLDDALAWAERAP